MRVIVTGSRSWDKPEPIWSILDIIAGETLAIGDEMVLVHGACPDGADMHADAWYRAKRGEMPLGVERHPAQWALHNKRAGFVRNQEMVRRGADLVLAFLRDDSPGTTQCIELAEREGLTVQVIDYEAVTVGGAVHPGGAP